MRTPIYRVRDLVDNAALAPVGLLQRLVHKTDDAISRTCGLHALNHLFHGQLSNPMTRPWHSPVRLCRARNAGRGQENAAGELSDRAIAVHTIKTASSIAQVLEHAGGYAPEEAKRLAEPMLPDILAYDPTIPVAYPNNGRLFTDDVGDRLVAILTNGRVTEDKVGPHDDFLPEFPYVGQPHEDRTEA